MNYIFCNLAKILVKIVNLDQSNSVDRVIRSCGETKLTKPMDMKLLE